MAVTSELKEWAPLADLFNKLPSRLQTGLFSQDVKLTCLDVLPDFLAIGTNLGLVYWYDRKTNDLQRLKCEKQNVQVTFVKVISTVDFMVACGGNDGCINIFQIPKSYPDGLPDNLKPKSKQVERYTVCDLHKSPITAIEWAKNGMKLFSGDADGCVVLTEIDFYMHICKSMEILNESYRVVQLSYNQQRLLISTTYRSIICQKHEKWKVAQVGKKDRKILGSFGGIVYQNGPKQNDIILYCTRPGLRIWLADAEGNVNKTLLFKDLLKKECLEVPILNPIPKHLKQLKPQQEPSFGIVLSFNDNLLLTYNNDVIYILDPKEMVVISTMSHFRSVLCVATCKDEIFVLEEDYSICRVSYRPEQNQECSNSVCQLGNAFRPLTSSLKGITTKLQSGGIVSGISPFSDNASNGFNEQTDESLIMIAEEAKESPIKLDTNLQTEQKFNAIGKQQFNDKILYKKSRKRNPMCASTSSLSSDSSMERDVIKPTLMSLSSVGVLPDLRSPESIQSDIEYKEKILADILHIDRVKISVDKMQETERQQPQEKSFTPPQTPIIPITVAKEATPKVVKELTPACVTIPDHWKLSDVQLNAKSDNSFSDNSLADWEIV